MLSSFLLSSCGSRIILLLISELCLEVCLLSCEPVLFSFKLFRSSSSSETRSFNFLITPLEKWARLASYSSTCLWMLTYWVSLFILLCISSSLKISFSVCLLWYYNSLVSWWFCKIVRRVVVESCSFLRERRLVLIYWILLSISKHKLTVTISDLVSCLHFLSLLVG